MLSWIQEADKIIDPDPKLFFFFSIAMSHCLHRPFFCFCFTIPVDTRVCLGSTESKAGESPYDMCVLTIVGKAYLWHQIR